MNPLISIHDKGPACTTVEEVYELMDGGMNIGRVNMSHIDRCSKRNHFQNIIEAGNRYGLEMDFSVPFGTMMDLKGPEIRTGMLQTVNYNPAVTEVKLQRGQTIRLTIDKNFENLCSDKFIYVDYEGLPLYAQPGMEIFISGRNIKLLVDFVDGLQIVCTVVTEGALRSFQQVHVPMLTMPMPAITEYDWECVELAVEMDVDIIVIPKTRNEEIVYKVKGFLDKKELKQRILVFAKISNYEGVRNIDAIIEAADGIVIHKHDLSLEIPCAKIFVAQKEIIAKCNKAAKPVVCCVELKSSPGEIAQYIIDGADCLMLTEETALGSNGPCAVETLSQIIREADAATSRLNFHSDLVELLPRTIEPTVAITMAAVETADKVQAAAILTITTTGRTAQLLSWFRPRCPVIAVTRFGRVARQLNMWRAVMPLVYYGPLEDDWFEDCNSRLRYAIAYGKDRKVIQPGDPLVLVTGYRKNAGFTNCLRVIFVTM
ncbi:UNVERIFIED_CONTAM: hypothetical protein PYX00_008337 [Menopon gallinae]|uniref:Pyruvate kinase n=1 Tax=Menopon gallinae TaxID=328185 RepID=A0AAW2HMQ4_9NEOP